MIKEKVYKFFKYIFNPDYRFLLRSFDGRYNDMEDRKYLEKIYHGWTGKKLDLDDPKTFNEKMQWLKLYYRKPVYTTMADKYAVKKYVSDKIGPEYVIPLLGVWDKFEDIDFSKLPEKFVLKTTHDCGGVVICKDKSIFDKEKASQRLNRSLKRDYYLTCREWPYKNVPHRIIAEKYIDDGVNDTLIVYKVFNFCGKPAIIQTIQGDKSAKESIDYFDTDWNLLDLRQNFPNSKKHLQRPESLDEILLLSKKCSEGFPFLRTDWYEVKGKVYFSEFTFFSDAGFERFYPDKWDRELGDLIVLPR